jgi:hypothetical protein
MFQIGRNTFYNQKNKILMKIPEFKRSGIGIIAEFRGILSRFPNQVPMAVSSLMKTTSTMDQIGSQALC